MSRFLDGHFCCVVYNSQCHFPWKITLLTPPAARPFDVVVARPLAVRVLCALASDKGVFVKLAWAGASSRWRPTVSRRLVGAAVKVIGAPYSINIEHARPCGDFFDCYTVAERCLLSSFLREKWSGGRQPGAALSSLFLGPPASPRAARS